MRALWTIVSLVAFAGLVACSSDGTDAQPSDAATDTVTVTSPASNGATSSPAVTRSATTTVTATASSSRPSTATGTRCRAASLALRQRAADGAGGTEYYTFVLRNTGASTCTLYGYPGVSVVDSAGKTVQRPAQRGRTSTVHSADPMTVTVRPKQSTYFLLTSINVIPSPGCAHA